MPEEKKETLHPEVTFLPPLNMALVFHEKESSPHEPDQTPVQPDEKLAEKDLKRIILRINQPGSDKAARP